MLTRLTHTHTHTHTQLVPVDESMRPLAGVSKPLSYYSGLLKLSFMFRFAYSVYLGCERETGLAGHCVRDVNKFIDRDAILCGAVCRDREKDAKSAKPRRKRSVE